MTQAGLSPLGRKVCLGETWGQPPLRGLSSVLCSRHRVRLEGNRGSHWTKGVEKVVSGRSGQEEEEGVEGGLGRGRGQGMRLKKAPRGLESWLLMADTQIQRPVL